MKTKLFYIIILLFANFGILFSQTNGNQNNQQKSLVVESIEISGNKRTPEDVILTNLDFEVGDRITTSATWNKPAYLRMLIFTHSRASRGDKSGFSSR